MQKRYFKGHTIHALLKRLDLRMRYKISYTVLAFLNTDVDTSIHL